MYIGRFAPSPTGQLHAGSLVAALASWLDARAHQGQWLVRMEDVDTPRCVPGTDHTILQQLAACGLHPDAPPVWQSQRNALYQQALDRLIPSGAAYPCACSRKDIETALAAQGATKPRHGELVYPGTCRNGLQGRTGRAWRLRTDGLLLRADLGPEFVVKIPVEPMDSAGAAPKDIASHLQLVRWTDRRLGPQNQDVAQDVGDFVLRRADGLWAYQLAVVVDDADQGITHIVRGEDLTDNTARQILLQQHLSLPTPQYLHTPLVLGANGEKLSKQNGAAALDTRTPASAWLALQQAASVLGLGSGPALGALPASLTNIADALAVWTAEWQARFASDLAVSAA
ncbi:MAG: tRNA glutamyl-Q(34) synthetase GluQRS [Burkholderiales bacterium PBB3]|nr:MAG: tRNA glutamyl-Q(34) synthetase GluQRS [Burkholderiales bacterium PBB3]